MTETDQKYRTLVILWFILLFSQLLFVVVIFSVKGREVLLDPEQSLIGDLSPIVIGAAILAVVNFAVSFVIRKNAIERGIAEQKPEYVQTALILGSVFCEAISIIGLILAFAFNYPHFYYWLIIGFIGIFLHFPRRKHLEEASR